MPSPGRAPRWAGLCGGVFGAAGVALSAYAAHAATGDGRQRLYTAAAMALVHGLLLTVHTPASPRLGRLAMAAIAIGVLLFCGSLVGAQLWGGSTRLAPAGGSLLIAGWLLLALDRGRG